MDRPSVFAVKIRWASNHDDTWEILTTHDGFRRAEDAALFANGFVSRSPAGLFVREEGRIEIVLNDGTALDLLDGEVELWRLPEDFDFNEPADDSHYRQVVAPLRLLIELGLGGEWTEVAWSVRDGKEDPVHVALHVSETGELCAVVVRDSPDVQPSEAASYIAGIIAKA